MNRALIAIGVAGLSICAVAVLSASAGADDPVPGVVSSVADSPVAPAPGTADLNTNATVGDAQHQADLVTARGMQPQALAIAKADQRLRTLLANSSYDVATQDTVVSGERVVGSALVLSFSTPQAVTAAFNAAAEDADPPVPGTKFIRTDGVTQLLVLVDVEGSKVVNFNALNGLTYNFLDAAGKVLGVVHV